MKTIRIPFLMVAVVALLHVNSVRAIMISDSATGSVRPGFLLTQQDVDTSLINGDFTINKNNPSSSRLLLGDGVDEVTTWSFDFNADPDLAALLASTDPLTSAILTLELTQRSRLITTDTVTILGALPEPDSSNPAFEPIQSLQPRWVLRGNVSTVQIDLLDLYTSDIILASLTGGDANMLPMQYHDDAIVSFAQLDLSTSVPDASHTILLLGMALIAVVGCQRRLAKARVTK